MRPVHSPREAQQVLTAYAEERLERYRTALEAPDCDEGHARVLRGRIAELKQLVKWAKEADEA